MHRHRPSTKMVRKREKGMKNTDHEGRLRLLNKTVRKRKTQSTDSDFRKGVDTKH